jgi:hypothetical protein
MTNTFEELERAAYMAGNTQLADAYTAMDTLERIDAELPLGFDFDSPMDQQIENRVEAEITKHCPNYAEYKEFFSDCFARLGAHYPCPSVTSDYDKDVIFAAIDKGEAE